MLKDNLFNLQLFDGDGGQGGSDGGQGGSAGAGAGGQSGNTGNNGGTYSFEQAEEIANARAARAEKAALSSYFKQQGMTEEEATQAIADYKARQAANKPDVTKVTQERDEARAELAAMKNSQALRAKGVKDEDLDYVVFKIQALMKEDDKLDFNKAADKYLQDNPRFTSGGAGSYRVKTGTDGSNQGSGSGQGTNDAINDAIRKAARKGF